MRGSLLAPAILAVAFGAACSPVSKRAQEELEQPVNCTGTEDDKLKVATGEYNQQIDRKIAEIKRTCGV